MSIAYWIPCLTMKPCLLLKRCKEAARQNKNLLQSKRRRRRVRRSPPRLFLLELLVLGRPKEEHLATNYLVSHGTFKSDGHYSLWTSSCPTSRYTAVYLLTLYCGSYNDCQYRYLLSPTFCLLSFVPVPPRLASSSIMYVCL